MLVLLKKETSPRYSLPVLVPDASTSQERNFRKRPKHGYFVSRLYGIESYARKLGYNSLMRSDARVPCDLGVE